MALLIVSIESILLDMLFMPYFTNNLAVSGLLPLSPQIDVSTEEATLMKFLVAYFIIPYSGMPP
jgi:hypothetical protein